MTKDAANIMTPPAYLLVPGDLLDLQGDQYCDPKDGSDPSIEFEYAKVLESVIYPPETLLGFVDPVVAVDTQLGTYIVPMEHRFSVRVES